MAFVRNMTVKVERDKCESSNNNNTIEANSLTSAATLASSSLDSVVQRLIDKKMGRRKQNCPQKTGATSEDGENNASGNPPENGQNNPSSHQDHNSDSASVASSTDKEGTLPTLEALEPDHTNGSTKKDADEAVNLLKQAASLVNPLLKMPVTSEADMVSNLLKTNPALLLNPTLLSLNPSLYAVQLAQLQLLAQQSNAAAASEAVRDSINPLAQVRKRKHEDHEDASMASAAALAGVLNLSSVKTSPASSPRLTESPLDLSGAKKALDSPAGAKVPKLSYDDKLSASALANSWHFLHPLLASGSLTPETLARLQMATAAEPKNPLERMSEIAKGNNNLAAVSSAASTSASQRLAQASRPSAWQSQWLNRGPESNKEIFKCVWCKESYPSLQSLTTHMKETKHFGGSIPASPTMPASTMPTNSIARPPIPSPGVLRPPPASSVGSTTSTSSKSRDILKEQLPMPRKLVRGQDVWLGRGEQQTRDILKCMWCGESFRSLDIMTKHMQETKHYTKVISQEQLMSWKSPEAAASSQNHVNAVLTCKVCDQGFSSLKDLSDHMVKNNHYKQDETPPSQQQQRARAGSTSPRAAVGMMASPTVSSSPGLSSGGQKEKRKKSLPVRKLLELERAQQELSGQVKPSDPAGRISCEKCGDKILMHLFVEHIRQCVGPASKPASSSLAATSAAAAASVVTSMADLTRFFASSAGTRTPSVSPPTMVKKSLVSPSPPAISASNKEDEPKSILGSLEKMVQNNFGSKKRLPDSNMSILQRLGIDEGVDYNKPLMDPMAMFRSPSHMAAAVAAAGGFPPGFFPHAISSAASTTTRSNSSECSSPDRFRAASERPPSAKSAASKSPAPAEEVPLAASVVKKSKIEEEEGDDGEEEDERQSASEAATAEAANNENHGSEAAESPKSSVVRSPSPAATPAEEEPPEAPSAASEDEAPAAEAAKPKKKSHPLAALQMLCDKTEKKSGSGAKNANSNNGSAAFGGPSSDPGAILAFSWACNQAVVNDSLLKCPFCDTPFISKGAYRHHLSKMHFVKDGGMMMASPANNPAASVASSTASSAASDGLKMMKSPTESKEENAQSKFQKYSQLAKQLSCGSSQP